VIQSFADQRTQDIWNGVTNGRTRSFPADLLPAAHRKLDMLNAAHVLNDLRSPPGNRLEALSGALARLHSIRINSQWRITFRWTPAGPADVKITDYH
jgi:toxin HigB-1